MPVREVWGRATLLRAGRAQYTATDYERFFDEVGYPGKLHAHADAFAHVTHRFVN